MIAASHLAETVPHPQPLKGSGKTCELVRETRKVSEECFLEPECGEECRTVQEKKCSTVQEEQCRTVQEEQCDTVQEEECKTVKERKCRTKTEKECDTGKIFIPYLDS